MPRLILIIIASVLLTIPVSAAAKYQMLTDLGSSAESIGRGNIEGFSYSSNSIFENPAALHRVEKFSAAMFSSTIINEINFNNFSLAYKTKKWGAFSLGYMSSQVADIPITEENDAGIFIQNGSFEYLNTITKLGYMYSINPKWHVGSALALYSNEIHTVTGTGYGLDIGSIYQFDKLVMSGFIRNITGGSVEYTDSADDSYSGKEDLPFQYVFGMGYPIHDFMFMSQYKDDGTNGLMSLGIGYTPRWLWDVLTIRAGYKEYSALADVRNTITLGVSLNLFGLNFDYAYEESEHIEYDSNTYFSLSMDF
ncbi:MAG: hypothetical protein O3A01_04885 [bacterium]|nr:hypothetical protein [bacterium]